MEKRGNTTSPKHYNTSPAEYKYYAVEKTSNEDFKSLLVKMINDIKEDISNTS